MEKILNNAIESIQSKFGIAVYENNIYRLTTPFFHRVNGEPYNIFLEKSGKYIYMTDLGETMVRLLEMIDTSKNYTLHKVSSIVEKYGCVVENDSIKIMIEDIEHIDMYLNMYIHALISIDNLFE